MFGKGYNKDYLDYVNVDAIGNIYNHIDSTSKRETAQVIGELLG